MASPNKRLTRVNELLRREIAEILLTRTPGLLKEPATVTVTQVEVSRDLRHARVLVSILGHEEERREIVHHLNQHRSDVQQEISKTVRLKYLPRLDFRLDESLEKGDRVLDILHQLEENDSNDLP